MQDSELSYRESMLEIYLFETVQMVEQLEELLIEIENEMSLSNTAINEIFRIMHTIKGSSAMMMYDGIAHLSHSLEDLFALLRNNGAKEIDCHQLTDIVLQTVDFIKGELHKIEQKEDPDGNNEGIVGRINAFQKQISEPKIIVKTYKALMFFDPNCEMENMRAYTVIHQLTPVAAIVSYEPADILENEETAELIRQEGFLVEFTSELTYDELLIHFDHTLFLERIDLHEKQESFSADVIPCMKPAEEIPAGTRNTDSIPDAGAAGQETPEEKIITADPSTTEPKAEKPQKAISLDVSVREDPAKNIPNNPSKNQPNNQSMNPSAYPSNATSGDQQDSKSLSTRQNLISVNVKKMDSLMDIVGELVISEAMVTKNPDLEGLELENFSKATRQLSKLTDELQDIVMSLRLIPISNTFQKMQRLVRDMKIKLNKEVDLQLIGEETEIDKNIADNISDPLMHIVRNALDHGIEDKATRLACGKCEAGKVSIEAKNAGGDVWITVKDDGAGLDKSKMYKKAKEKGLVTKNESEYSEKEIFNFIMLPGFSMKEKVSEFSGRGVGMDVVRENISKLGGSVILDSKTGMGTSIRIRIPMTLAIIDGILVSVGTAKYIIPTTAIRESFRPVEKQIIIDTEGTEMIMIRGECYRILRLHERLNVETSVKSLMEGIIVVIEDEEKLLCVFADELIGKQQVVVKPIPAYIRKSEAIAGCTILGDGNISLILDAKGMINS